VPLATGFGLATIGWTTVGGSVAVAALQARRGDVVVAGSRGIRTERLTRDGHRVVAEVAWHDVRDARLRPGGATVALNAGGGVTVLSRAGDPAQHREIQQFVNDRVAALPDRPPIVVGWTAYLDDRGATLVERRAFRKNGAMITAPGAVLGGVNAAAFAAAGVWPAAVLLGAATAGLAAATAVYLRWTPRWIARPGAVVLERRPGAGFAFEANRLELVRFEGKQVTHRLVAVSSSGGRRRRTMLWEQAHADAGELEDVGRWLARHAEIPYETRVESTNPS